jgi:rod shape-determining protein MreC
MPFSLKERSKFALFAGLIFFHLILISLQVPKGNEPTYFKRALFAAFSPVQHGVVSFFRGVNGFWNRYFYLRQVQRQNQRMRDEIFLLRQENQALKNMLLKFKGEKEIQELLATVSRSILVCSVIGFDSSEIYKSIVLNKGSQDGVRKDMVVLDKRGRLVGRVINPVTLRQARVQLVTDKESGVGVLSERQRVVGILTGYAEGKCLMKYVFRTNKDIGEGEEVSTSGFEGIYPSGIPVGKIISITEDATLFKKIIVEPYLDFSELDEVAVFTIDLRELS